MSTLVYCLSDKIANVFRAQLADTPISFSATDTEDLVSAVLSNNADFLLIQVQSDPAGYREKLMQLYMAGSKVHIIIFHIGKAYQLASSFDPVPADKDFCDAKDMIYKALFMSILQTRRAAADDFQFTACPDIARRAARYAREEHLREILSGVSVEQFREIKREFNLDIGSPQGHYLIVTKAMPHNYFDDYTHNRRVYRMLDELVYDGLYSIVRRYCGGEIFEISNNSKCIIINDLNQPSAKKYVAQYNALMSEIKKITDDGMTALFVSRHIDSVTDFNTAYRECISAKRMRVFYGEDSMLPVSVLRQKRPAPDMDELDRRITSIRDFSIITPIAVLGQDINHIFLNILKPSANINMYYYACSAINVIYDAFCQRYGVTPEKRAMSRCFDKYVTVEEMAVHYIRVFRSAQISAGDMSGDVDILTYKMTAFIEKKYAQDISLGDLAEFVGFSTSYTSRYFHKHTGKSFSNYLTELRIEQAKKLLSESDRPVVTTIAKSVGYNNPQFFSRTFKELTGLTPTEYAEKNRKL